MFFFIVCRDWVNGRSANIFEPAQQQRGGGRSTPLEKKVLYLQKSVLLRNENGTISYQYYKLNYQGFLSVPNIACLDYYSGN